MRDTVLVVEDDDELRRMFRQVLSLAGFDVQEARDGQTAVCSIDQHPPTVVVLDLGLRAIRAYVVLQAHTRHIPVIIVTDQAGADQPKGAVCVLRKPITPDRLVNTVRGCVAAGGSNTAAVKDK